jgi:hypothetical protein
MQCAQLNGSVSDVFNTHATPLVLSKRLWETKRHLVVPPGKVWPGHSACSDGVHNTTSRSAVGTITAVIDAGVSNFWCHRLASFFEPSRWCCGALFRLCRCFCLGCLARRTPTLSSLWTFPTRRWFGLAPSRESILPSKIASRLQKNVVVPAPASQRVGEANAMQPTHVP